MFPDGLRQTHAFSFNVVDKLIVADLMGYQGLKVLKDAKLDA